MNNKTIDGVPLKALQDLVNGTRQEHKAAIVEMRDFLRALLDAKPCGLCGKPTVCGKPTCEDCAYEIPAAQPELTVWYGTLPESNGKTNWTAMLHRKDDLWGGITLDRSEYPDRVRYEADRMRYMIGELDIEPFILDYDDKLHSGYKGDE